jgi:hypothetical protein
VSEPNKFAITLDELVSSVRVSLDDLVEEHDPREHPHHDEAAGHLPGNVRPFGA